MNENAIDRKLVCAFIDGLISDDGERKKGLEYIRNMPPVNPQEPKTETWSIKDVADTFKKHGLIREQGPKTGHWIKMLLTDMSDIAGQCSECGFIHKFVGGHTAQYNYCPNCGCRMVEPQERSDKE